MISSFYVKLVLIIAAAILAIVFVAGITKAETPTYPCSFQKVADLVKLKGLEVSEGIMGLEVLGPGDPSINPDGKILFLAGYGAKGVGCGIVLLSSEGDGFFGNFVYYFPEENKFVVQDMITGQVTDITTEGACEFAFDW